MDKEKTFVYIIIALIVILLCTTASTVFYKNKYDRAVEQYRLELSAARERASIYSEQINRARESVGAIGESLSRQRGSVAELRELFNEVRERYEEMENILSSAGCIPNSDDYYEHWDNYLGFE